MNYLKAFRSRTVKLLSSFYAVKMVRYFENPFPDFNPDSETSKLKLNKDQVILQIQRYVDSILKRQSPTRSKVDGGLYVGIPGISYMFYRLSKNPILYDKKQFFIDQTIKYLEPAARTSAGDKTSFLLGDAGVYALTAVVFKHIDPERSMEALNEYKSLYKLYLNPKFLACGGDELFVGRAGYLAGALWLGRELQGPTFTEEELYKICDLIIQNGAEYSKEQGSPCPLMFHYYQTQYLGAAHGISFILQILLTVPNYLNVHSNKAKLVKTTIDYILGMQTKEGNWPCCMEEAELNEHKLVHWCHGAPGTIYLMAKAYLVYDDKKYLESCIRAGELVWKKGLLRKGPGICHGVAGNGYVFLLLYRLTKDPKYLYRAEQFVNFLSTDEFIQEARLPDNPESLYEGTAGTVCFLSDFLVPDKAEFPFQDVFVTFD